MDTTAPSPAARHYLCAFFLLIFIAMAFPFVAERTPGLRQMSEIYYTEALDETYAAKNVNADVVIVGDSTALFGPNVSELSKILSLKVINLPQTLGTLPLTKERPIEHYLEYNKPPKLFVLHMAPWCLDAFHFKDGRFYEGVETVVRNGGFRDWVEAVTAKPWEFLVFPVRYYLVQSRLNKLWAGSDIRGPVVRPALGHADIPRSIYKPLENPCTFPSEWPLWTNADSAEQVKRQFTTSETKVLIYLPPIPACTNVQQVLSMKHGNLHLQPSLVLPPSDFTMESPAHPFPESSDVRTKALALAIKKAMAQ